MGDPWQLRPSAVVTVPQVLLVWLLSSLLLLLLKWRMLGDPFYWDELACYFSQVYEMTHRLSAYLASRPMYVRSPLLTSVLALLHHYVNDSRELQRATVLLFCALAPASAYALACQLGGTRRTGILAAVLCGLTPAFFAQAGLVQMDLPATGLCTLAFVCLLRGSFVGYALLGGLAVLIKESTYWICLSAALFTYLRLVLIDRRPPLRLGTLLRLWPTAIPGVVLFFWLLVHRRITGAMISSDHTAVLSLGGVFPSLLHNMIEGGRLPLSLLALAQLRNVFRDPPAASPNQRIERLGVLCTACLWLSLPLAFPGHLVRYLLPTLPALCALAALGVTRWPTPQRVGMSALCIGWLLLNLRGDSFHHNAPFELEGNLSYRLLLREQMMVAQRIADSGAQRVIADFPFSSMLSAPPIFGYLPKPLSVTGLDRLHDPQQLCWADVVVVTQVSALSFPMLEKAKQQGILSLWFVAAADKFPVGKGFFTPRSARTDLTVSVYRVNCPAALP